MRFMKLWSSVCCHAEALNDGALWACYGNHHTHQKKNQRWQGMRPSRCVYVPEMYFHNRLCIFFNVWHFLQFLLIYLSASNLFTFFAFSDTPIGDLRVSCSGAVRVRPLRSFFEFLLKEKSTSLRIRFNKGTSTKRIICLWVCHRLRKRIWAKRE